MAILERPGLAFRHCICGSLKPESVKLSLFGEERVLGGKKFFFGGGDFVRGFCYGFLMAPCSRVNVCR